MTGHIYKSHLRSKEVRELQQELPSKWVALLDKKDVVERWQFDIGTTLILVNHIPLWFITQIPNQDVGKLTPFLPVLTQLINGNMQLPEVVVDMGAVPYVANGADIMAPGIVEIEESLKQEMFAVITDIRNHKPLGIGLMLRDRDDIIRNPKGKALESIHYVGDKIWKIIQSH